MENMALHHTYALLQHSIFLISPAKVSMIKILPEAVSGASHDRRCPASPGDLAMPRVVVDVALNGLADCSCILKGSMLSPCGWSKIVSVRCRAHRHGCLTPKSWFNNLFSHKQGEEH